MLGLQLGFELQDVYKPHLLKNVLNMMYLAQVLMKTLYYDLFLSPDLNQRSVLVVQLLSTKIVHFYDKSMKLCQITTNPKTNIFGYGAKPNSTLDMSTAEALKWLT